MSTKNKLNYPNSYISPYSRLVLSLKAFLTAMEQIFIYFFQSDEVGRETLNVIIKDISKSASYTTFQIYSSSNMQNFNPKIIYFLSKFILSGRSKIDKKAKMQKAKTNDLMLLIKTR